MEPDEVREIEVEVVPPGGKTRLPRASAEPGHAAKEVKGVEDPFIAFMSQLLDSAFTVPGTKIKFGFDPLIGLIPGIGDTATALTSLLLIWKSAQHGLPRIVLARMALNVLINAALGAIPILGDAFSVFFRSNTQNYELFRKHAGTRPASTRPDWLFVSLLIFGTVLALGLVVFAAFAWFQIVASLFRGITAQ